MHRLSRWLGACGAAALWAMPVTAQRLGTGAAVTVPFGRVALALLFCCAVAVAIVLLRRGSLAGIAGRARVGLRDRHIEVVETRRVSVHADACLIRCGAREYLVLAGTHRHTVLADREAPAEERCA